jgi:subtilisin-like proprotein convertase family protein
MKSIVPGRKADENEDFTNFGFTSIRHYGERSRGVWTVRILDPEENGNEGYVTKVSLRAFGS